MKRSNPTPRAWKVQRGSTRYPCKGKHLGKTVRRYGREYRVDGCATPKRGTTVGQYILARLPDGEPQHAVPKPAVGRALARARKGEPNTGWRERVPRLRRPAPATRVRQPEMDGPAWRAPRVPEMKGPKWLAPRYYRVTRYGLRSRPAGYATVPDGWVQDREATEQFHYGVIRYPAPLTEKQMYRYELTPWYDTPQDAAATLWESIDKLHREIIAASLAGRPLPGYGHAKPWEFIRDEAEDIHRQTRIWPLGQYSAQEIEPVMREMVVLFGPGTPDPGRPKAPVTAVQPAPASNSESQAVHLAYANRLRSSRSVATPPRVTIGSPKTKSTKPNTVYLEVVAMSGQKLSIVSVPHDGTIESIREGAKATRNEAFAMFPDASNAGSRSMATGPDGKAAWAISPNFLYISPVGSDDAAYILGDVSRAPPANVKSLISYLSFAGYTLTGTLEGRIMSARQPGQLSPLDREIKRLGLSRDDLDLVMKNVPEQMRVQLSEYLGAAEAERAERRASDERATAAKMASEHNAPVEDVLVRRAQGSASYEVLLVGPGKYPDADIPPIAPLARDILKKIADEFADERDDEKNRITMPYIGVWRDTDSGKYAIALGVDLYNHPQKYAKAAADKLARALKRELMGSKPRASAGVAGPSQSKDLPTDPTVIREHIQQIDDVVSLKRERGENVPQEWLNKRAALAAGLSGGSEPSGVASMLVYGHPQATTLRAHKYGNLVPISVTRVDSIERRMDEAQAAFAELASKIGMAEDTAKRKSASTADRKRAKAYLASMEHTEDATIRDMIHNETQPELNRLYRLLVERSR